MGTSWLDKYTLEAGGNACLYNADNSSTINGVLNMAVGMRQRSGGIVYLIVLDVTVK